MSVRNTPNWNNSFDRYLSALILHFPSKEMKRKLFLLYSVGCIVSQFLFSIFFSSNRNVFMRFWWIVLEISGNEIKATKYTINDLIVDGNCKWKLTASISWCMWELAFRSILDVVFDWIRFIDVMIHIFYIKSYTLVLRLSDWSISRKFKDESWWL